MKPLAPYFGNRFASVTKKKAIKSAAKTKATSEMETLESRILLSGVGTGLNKKNVSFFDADGEPKIIMSGGRPVLTDKAMTTAQQRVLEVEQKDTAKALAAAASLCRSRGGTGSLPG